MKNNADPNFAIAVIALVSACVGFAFWLNQANHEIVYSGTTSKVATIDSMRNSEEFTYSNGEAIADKERVFTLRELGSDELLKNGEVFISDMSLLTGYPSNGTEDSKNPFGSLSLWGESLDKRYIGFTDQPLGGGVGYSPVYYVDTNNIEKGITTVEDFYMYEGVSPETSRVVGLDRKMVYFEQFQESYPRPDGTIAKVFDLNTREVNTVLELGDDRTFLIPGHFGADPFYPEWEDENTLIIYDYDKEDIVAEDLRTDFDVTQGWMEKNRTINTINLR